MQPSRGAPRRQVITKLHQILKPFLLRWLFTNTDHDRLLFLDADLFPIGSLADGFTALDDATILPSPHLLDPCPAIDAVDVETLCLQVGTFNGGCLGLRRAPETDRFLDWFTALTARYAFMRRRGMYGEQLWLNLVPSFFPGVNVWRHPGTNVANWNLHERVLRRVDGDYTANGRPLLFTHMSGWRFDAPDDWTLGRPLAPGTDASIIPEIGRRYRDALAAAGLEECRRWPYGFGTFSSGGPITLPMRREWYQQVMAGVTSAASPFDHPEWFRGPRYVEWKRYVPLPVKRFLHKLIRST